MADHDYVRRAELSLAEFVARLEEISQESAGTETALYGAEYDVGNARLPLEHEMSREVDRRSAIREVIDEGVATRQAMLDEEIAKRHAEWGDS